MSFGKSELTEALRSQLGLSLSKADLAVELVVDRVTAALKAGERVEFRGLGSFTVKDAAAREARNPRTGEAIAVPAGKRIAFRPSAVLKAALNPVAPSIPRRVA